MRTRILFVISAAVLAGCAEASVGYGDLLGEGGDGKTDAYGKDLRVDLYESNATALAAGRSIALVTKADEIGVQNGKPVLLPYKGSTLAEAMSAAGTPLCPSEPFRDQPVRGRGTAFLVAPDTVATAAHVAIGIPCAQMRLVFDFAYRTDPSLEPDGLAAVTYPATSNVYGCREVIEAKDDRADVALIRLDRSVDGRDPLPLSPSGRNPGANVPVAMIGHPNALPAKLTAGITVDRQLPISFPEGGTVETFDFGFFTTLGAYHGNSGSPVFSRAGVVGVLVNGDTDFVKNEKGNCYMTHVCAADASDCTGEYVIRSSYLIDLL